MTDNQLSRIHSILDMIDEAEGQFLELGHALRKLRDEDPHAFATMIDTPGLGRRRAYYLVEIAKAFDDKPHLHGKLRLLGWTKAAALASHASAPNLDELMQLATEITAYELKAFLKDGPDGLGKQVLAFSFGAPDFAKVSQVLKANGALGAPIGLRNKEAALLRALSMGKKTPQKSAE